jgi:hypothetical protein
MLLHWSIKYVVVVLAIFSDVLEDMWMDSFLASRGMTPHEVIWDDLISGSLVGILLLVLLVSGDRARHEQRKRLKLIAEMNHHVRNALQIIYSSAACSSDKRHLDQISSSVDRIDWALREILPGFRGTA